MEDKTESKKNTSHKKVYVKPKLNQIPLDDEEGLLEYCKGKPYSAQELKKWIEEMLSPKRGK